VIFLGAPFPQVSRAAVPIEIGGGRIEIVFSEDDSDFPRALTREWVATAAGAVTKRQHCLASLAATNLKEA